MDLDCLEDKSQVTRPLQDLVPILVVKNIHSFEIHSSVYFGSNLLSLSSPFEKGIFEREDCV